MAEVTAASKVNRCHGAPLRDLAASYARLARVGFLFDSIANLATGVVVGVELLPRRQSSGLGEVMAADTPRRHRRSLDVGLAAAGLRWAAESGVRLPVHLNLQAETLTGPPDILNELRVAMGEVGGDLTGVVVEIGDIDGDPAELVDGARWLRGLGATLLVDEVRSGSRLGSLLTSLRPEQVKLDPGLVAELPHPSAAEALAEVLRRCRDTGTEVVAGGIHTWAQLKALRAHGVPRGQGSRLARPARRPPAQVAVSPTDPSARGEPARMALVAPVRGETGFAMIGGYARAVTTMPVDATGDQVRDVFRDAPTVTMVVLIDAERRPVGALDRNRFLLAVSGQFGHALHARRPVRSLADPPRTLMASAGPREALDLLAHGEPQRRNDDIVITDRGGRCIGIAHMTDLLRGIAELGYQRAMALHPTTGLGGTPVFAQALRRRLRDRRGLAVARLVPDIEPLVEQHGFAAADAALHLLMHALRSATAAHDPGAEIAHVLDGLVVITRPERVSTLDDAVRRALRARGGPELCSAWLICQPTPSAPPDEVEAHLAQLMRRARLLGPGTAVVATPGSIGEPHHLRLPSAFQGKGETGEDLTRAAESVR